MLLAVLVAGGGCQSYYDGSERRTTGEFTDDAGIQFAVKRKLIGNRATRGWRIDVDVRQGVVSLRGRVRSEAERQTALDIARNTVGVKDVRDELSLAAADTAPAGDER